MFCDLPAVTPFLFSQPSTNVVYTVFPHPPPHPLVLFRFSLRVLCYLPLLLVVAAA